MEFTFELTVKISGEATEDETIEFIKYSLGIGSTTMDNPFISEEDAAKIEDVEIL
jgi:hypothetical protein